VSDERLEAFHAAALGKGIHLEPGLYFQEDDLLVIEKLLGISIGLERRRGHCRRLREPLRRPPSPAIRTKSSREWQPFAAERPDAQIVLPAPTRCARRRRRT
jgi:hypothetical protein